MSNLVNVLSKLNIKDQSAVIFNNAGAYPTSPTIGQLAFVDKMLSIYTDIDGLGSWHPLVNAKVPTYTHTQGLEMLTWTVNHGLDSDDLMYFVYDDQNQVVYPSSVNFVDNNTVTLEFTEAVKGKVVVFSAALSAARIFDHPAVLFNTLSITSMNYDGNGNLTDITYDTGNKQILNYDGDNVASVQYTGTDGTTVTHTQTMSYDGEGNLTTTTWS